jgi:hypothetical protein
MAETTLLVRNGRVYLDQNNGLLSLTNDVVGVTEVATDSTLTDRALVQAALIDGALAWPSLDTNPWAQCNPYEGVIRYV